MAEKNALHKCTNIHTKNQEKQVPTKRKKKRKTSEYSGKVLEAEQRIRIGKILQKKSEIK